MFSRSRKPPLLRRLAVLGLCVPLAGAALFYGALAAVGWWIDYGDEPVKADVLVVLAGDYTRSMHAADLYAQGYAPKVWISHCAPSRAEELLKQLGIDFPDEPGMHRRILLRKGVPDRAIQVYGKNVYSTKDEAVALGRELGPGNKRILVVTSRYHARRAKMILRHHLPGLEIAVASTPYEHFDRSWWKNKELAQASILEGFKLVYYLAGGHMTRKPLPST